MQNEVSGYEDLDELMKTPIDLAFIFGRYSALVCFSDLLN